MFEDLFKYQELDVELLKIDNELKSSKEYKEYKINYINFEEAKKQIAKLEGEAQVIQSGSKKLADISAEIDKRMTALEDIKAIIENEAEIEDVSELDYYQERMQKILDELATYEKELKAIEARIADINKKYSEAVSAFKESAKGGKAATAAYKVLKDGYSERENAIKTELSNLNGELHSKYPQIMEIYDRLRKEKRLPAIVQFNNGYCGRCGMELSGGTSAKLKESGSFAECQHCYCVNVVK